MDHNVFFNFTGNERVYSQNLFHSIKNTFTYELWVKPDAAHKIDREAQRGVSGVRGQKYIISPEHGGEQNKAGIGISIGINGVSVYEHTVNHLPCSLSYPSIINDWVYVAVVYMDRIPHLYLNGVFVKKGVKSLKDTVYASGIFGGLDPYGSFVGQLKYIRLWSHARSEVQIRENMHRKLTEREPGLFGLWEFDRYPKNKSGILFINHTWGGGTEHYQNMYIEKIKHESIVYKLKYDSIKYQIDILNPNSPSSYSLRFTNCDLPTFRYFLQLLDVGLIYINHLISYPVFQLMDLVQNSNVDYHYFVHDYFCACPRINLINSKGVYCNSETNTHVCQNCMNKTERKNIQTWRERFSSFLSRAKKVMAPSNSTKDIVQKYYPHIPIEVQEHSLPKTIHYTFHPQFAMEPVLNIAFIGFFQPIKGLGILYDIKNAIQRENLPINIKVLGTTDKHTKHYVSHDGKYVVTGEYRNNDISDLLAKHKISVVVIPSVCPETFSYTTSEAMLSGYPVITFNLGAPAERVRRFDGGWVVAPMTSNGILQVLKRIVKKRHEILEKAENLSKAY